MAAASRSPEPLTHAQLHAAERLFTTLPHWSATDAALRALAARFPDVDETSVLLKVVAVNALYFTNIYALNRMADHVHRVLSEPAAASAGAELVERMGTLPPRQEGEKTRRNVSFASKYAHFFIDSDRFPILDKYARVMLRLHLGRSGSLHSEQPYEEYVRDFQELQAQLGWVGDSRSIDRYLWLAGLHRAWVGGDTKINREAQDLFASPTTAQRTDLRELVGQAAGN